MRITTSLLALLSMLTCCTTYSITMVHTEGSAADVVDGEQAPTTVVTPTVSIPASIIPKV